MTNKNIYGGKVNFNYYMKRTFQILMFIIASNIVAYGQSIYGKSVKADVKMKYVYSFEEALKLSKETGKPIFFNCFADWAVPCHGMNKKVFSDQEFSDWMDKNFVNFFTDVTKGNGRVLASKYNVKTMAHYLVLDSDGEIIHRIVGGSEILEFKAHLQKALNPKTSLRGLSKQYEDGNGKIKFLREYFDALTLAEEMSKAREVLDVAFSVVKQKDWSKKENWKLYTSIMKTPEDAYFKYLIDNQQLFAKNNGVDKVSKALSTVLTKALSPYVLGLEPYDAQKMLDIYLLIQKANLPEEDEVNVYYTFTKNRGEHNIEALVDILENQGKSWDSNTLRIIDLSLVKIEDFNKKLKKRLLL